MWSVSGMLGPCTLTTSQLTDLLERRELHAEVQRGVCA
jgi:hypothetical protein